MNRFGDITDMLLQGLFLQLNIFSDEEDAVFFRKDIRYLSLARETHEAVTIQSDSFPNPLSLYSL